MYRTITEIIEIRGCSSWKPIFEEPTLLSLYRSSATHSLAYIPHDVEGVRREGGDGVIDETCMFAYVTHVR